MQAQTWLKVMVVLVVAVVLGGCDRSGPASQSAGGGDALPATLILPEPPGEVRELAEVKATARAGDQVVLRGKVGGRRDPFIANRAVVMLVDAGVAACGENDPTDRCPTPWDYCCEPPEVMAAKSATVQVAGADGKPLRATLRGFGGIEPHSEIAVVGIVQERPDEKTLVIRATGIHVKRRNAATPALSAPDPRNR